MTALWFWPDSLQEHLAPLTGVEGSNTLVAPLPLDEAARKAAFFPIDANTHLVAVLVLDGEWRGIPGSTSASGSGCEEALKAFVTDLRNRRPYTRDELYIVTRDDEWASAFTTYQSRIGAILFPPVIHETTFSPDWWRAGASLLALCQKPAELFDFDDTAEDWATQRISLVPGGYLFDSGREALAQRRIWYAKEEFYTNVSSHVASEIELKSYQNLGESIEDGLDPGKQPFAQETKPVLAVTESPDQPAESRKRRRQKPATPDLEAIKRSIDTVFRDPDKSRQETFLRTGFKIDKEKLDTRFFVHLIKTRLDAQHNDWESLPFSFLRDLSGKLKDLEAKNRQILQELEARFASLLTDRWDIEENRILHLNQADAVIKERDRQLANIPWKKAALPLGILAGIFVFWAVHPLWQLWPILPGGWIQSLLLSLPDQAILPWPPSLTGKLILTGGSASVGILVAVFVGSIILRSNRKATDRIERQAAEAMHKEKEEATACATRDLEANRMSDELYFRDALGRFLPAAIEHCNAITARAEHWMRNLKSPATGMIPAPTATGGPFTLLAAETTEDAAAMEDAARICLRRHFVQECIIPDPEAPLSCLDPTSLEQAMRKDEVLRYHLDQAERTAIADLGFEHIATERAQDSIAPEDCFPGLDHASWAPAYCPDVILLCKADGAFGKALRKNGAPPPYKTIEWKATSQALVLLRYIKKVIPPAPTGVGP